MSKQTALYASNKLIREELNGKDFVKYVPAYAEFTYQEGLDGTAKVSIQLKNSSDTYPTGNHPVMVQGYITDDEAGETLITVPYDDISATKGVLVSLNDNSSLLWLKASPDWKIYLDFEFDDEAKEAYFHFILPNGIVYTCPIIHSADD